MTDLRVVLQRLGLEDGHTPLVEQALTHRSLAGVASYERLEFLGDRALGLVAAAWIFRTLPEADEGTLSLHHTALVRWQTCAQVGEAWALWPLIRCGVLENTPTPAVRQRLLADVVEALLGVVFLAKGHEAVAVLVERDWPQPGVLTSVKDAKTALQELLQERKLALPDYRVVETSGPDHARHFVVDVISALGTARGEGPSKAVASLMAAQTLMEQLA